MPQIGDTVAKVKKQTVFLIDRKTQEGRERGLYEILYDLVGKFHTDLAEARIALAWKHGWKENVDGQVKLGQCKKGSDFDKALAGFDFVILLNFERVNGSDFSPQQLRALIDHELCHGTVAVNAKGETKEQEDGRPVYRVRKHDVEEFREIVERYGLWKADLEAFGVTAGKAAQQAGLFDAAVKGHELKLTGTDAASPLPSDAPTMGKPFARSLKKFAGIVGKDGVDSITMETSGSDGSPGVSVTIDKAAADKIRKNCDAAIRS